LLLPTKEAADEAEYPINDEAQGARNPEARAFGPIYEVVARHTSVSKSDVDFGADAEPWLQVLLGRKSGKASEWYFEKRWTLTSEGVVYGRYAALKAG